MVVFALRPRRLPTEPQCLSTEYYDSLLVPPSLKPLGVTLRSELAETVEDILKITDQVQLLDNDPVVRRAVEARVPFTDPLNVLQANILSRLRGTDYSQNGKAPKEGEEEARMSEDRTLQDALIVSIIGISRGVGNTVSLRIRPLASEISF